MQRRINVDASKSMRRCIEVMCPFGILLFTINKVVSQSGDGVIVLNPLMK